MTLVHADHATNGHFPAPTAGIEIDHAAVLHALNLNPRDPKTQALLLVCERYGMDPLLKHMVLIQGSPYITRDGYLAVAHRSGQFDGMEVVDQGDDQTHYWAKVAIYRKDMSRPITMLGRFPKSKSMAKEYGPEMAIKCAEVAAMRRAFNVTGVPAADERWDYDANDRVEARAEVLNEAAAALDAGPTPTMADRAQLETLFTRLDAVKAADAAVAKTLATAWKQNGLPAKASPDRFTAADAETLGVLLAKAEADIAAAAPSSSVDVAFEVLAIKERVGDLPSVQQRAFAAECKTSNLPSVDQPDVWTAEWVATVNGLLDELEASAAAAGPVDHVDEPTFDTTAR